MKKIKTPQEKKVLSYKKDRRNIYGESSKGFRRIIPRRKKMVNEDFRRRVKYAIKKEINNEDIDEIENAVKGIKRKEWRKYPDAPLGEVIQRKKLRNFLVIE